MIPPFMILSSSDLLMMPNTTILPRRDFLTGALALGASTFVKGADDTPAMLGPILGHSDETSAMVWMRTATT
jgi:hypothetical protein